MMTPEWLYQTLKDRVEKIAREEAENAAKRVRERVQGAAGEMAVAVLSQYSIERDSYGLVIRVKIQ